MLLIEPGNPRHPASMALLLASHDLMQRLFSPEENHFLSVDELCEPDIRFFTARRGKDIVGCAALALRDGYGEIKSMFVTAAARGTGAADALMRQLEDEARAAALPFIRLETGDVLTAAHRLYARHGFTDCEPFGEYEANTSSVFMEKALT